MALISITPRNSLDPPNERLRPRAWHDTPPHPSQTIRSLHGYPTRKKLVFLAASSQWHIRKFFERREKGRSWIHADFGVKFWTQPTVDAGVTTYSHSLCVSAPLREINTLVTPIPHSALAFRVDRPSHEKESRPPKSFLPSVKIRAIRGQ